MESEDIRKEVARSLSIEAVKQRKILDKTNWTPAAIVEELDKLYKYFYNELEGKDIIKC